MAIGVDQIYLSMTDPDTGEYLTADVYTVDGVYEADGVTLRRLSVGQLVMALCLKRATDLETGYFYPDPVTGEEQYEKGIVGRRSPTTGLYHRGYMDDVEDASEQLRCMTEIENAVLSGTVTLLTGTTQQKLHAGESFCLHPRTAHLIVNESKHPAKFIWVTDPPNF